MVGRPAARGVVPSYRTTVAGGHVIVTARTRALYEHVDAALRYVQRDPLDPSRQAIVRASDAPHQLVKFRLTDAGTLTVSTVVQDVEVFKSDPRGVWPAWFDDALQIAERLSAVPYERSLLHG